MAMIDARGLTYRYDPTAEEPVLQGINFSIAAGEYVLLCGASGSGKSTLCRILNGLIPHFHGGRLEGRVTLDGLDVLNHPIRELFAHVGLVFQNSDAQLFNSTVERELAFGLESLGLPPEQIRRRTQWAAGVLGLEHLMDRRPAELSGGEKQMVAIGAMLALRPAILALDEPYANLDPVAATDIRDALREINDLGTTIVLAEHRLHDIVADADRMMVLHRGRIVLDGPPQTVLREDVTRYGLTEPYAVQWGKAQGLSPLPISVDEALEAVDRALDEQLKVAQRATVARLGGRPRQEAVEQPAQAVIEVEDVAYRFDGELALDGAFLEIRRGECLTVVGPNGSGKTTLIKHFNGLYKPDRGQVTVLGRDTRQTPTSELARHVGLVFQNPNDQFFRATVRQEIVAGSQALEFSHPTWHNELLDLFDIELYLDRPPYRLSEGEKKRVAFASALATRPEIIVLDEPTTGQDRRFRELLKGLLDELQRRDHTIVLVTHDLEFASAVADRWAVLADGQVIAEGDPDVLMADDEVIGQASLHPTEKFRLHQALRERSSVKTRTS